MQTIEVSKVVKGLGFEYVVTVAYGVKLRFASVNALMTYLNNFSAHQIVWGAWE